MFCKNDSVKQKKQVLSVKQTEYYASTDVIALKSLNEIEEEKEVLLVELEEAKRQFGNDKEENAFI